MDLIHSWREKRETRKRLKRLRTMDKEDQRKRVHTRNQEARVRRLEAKKRHFELLAIAAGKLDKTWSPKRWYAEYQYTKLTNKEKRVVDHALGVDDHDLSSPVDGRLYDI